MKEIWVYVSQVFISEVFCLFGGRRLGPDASVHAGNGIFLCALCRCSLETEAGFSVHAGSFFSQVGEKAWEGPFLCANCKTQQNAEKAAQQQDVQEDVSPDAEKDGATKHETAEMGVKQ